MRKGSSPHRQGEGLDPILQILVDDARITPDQIATMGGSTERAVRKRIADWEQERLILHYKAVVDRERAGVEEVTAMIEIRANLQSGLGFEQVARTVARFDQVRSLSLVSGNYDLLAVVAGKTMRDISNFVAESLAPLDRIQTVTTHFLLRLYKDDGDIFDSGDEVSGRLPVAP